MVGQGQSLREWNTEVAQAVEKAFGFGNGGNGGLDQVQVEAIAQAGDAEVLADAGAYTDQVAQDLRDYVDARTSLGEFLLPVSIVFVVASLLVPSSTWAGLALIVLFYVLVLIVAVDTFLMTRRLKKRFVEKFGWKKLPRGWTFYVIARQLNIRRFRAPKPVVKRGEFPV